MMQIGTHKRFTPAAILWLWMMLLPLYGVVFISSIAVQALGAFGIAAWYFVWIKFMKLDLLFYFVPGTPRHYLWAKYVAAASFLGCLYLIWSLGNGVAIFIFWSWICCVCTAKSFLDSCTINPEAI